jgi:hypothetical protein
MIPDFPDEKEKLMRYWNNYLVAKHNQILGIIGTIPSHMNHEGHRWLLNRADGSGNESQYNEIQGLLTIKDAEAPNLTFEKIREKFDAIAEDMARQTFQGMLSVITHETDRVGNSINADGQSFTQDFFLQMMERMDQSFDENGNWIPPTMILSPETLEKHGETMKSWETDPVFIARQAEILARKKDEWNDRENRRKLVD